MGTGPVPVPILQIHASRKCNLSCPHCYSESSPSAADELPVEVVCELIEDAAELGYRGIAFSGGEPLVYPGLVQVLSYAKALGLNTSVTTNGTLLQSSRLAPLEGLVSLLAVSLDGRSATHNRTRGSRTAFRRLLHGMPKLKSTGMRFGFIHTLTRDSWEELPWLADFAYGHGASLLQIHPLELFGRAEREMRSQIADEELLMRAYLLCAAVSIRFKEDMVVQIDLVHRDQALSDPGRLYAAEPGRAAQRAADLLSIIVLEPDGTLVPVAYGFSRDFAICNIRQQRFADAWPIYAEHGYRRFLHLCRDALAVVATPGGPELFNWHDLIVQQSLHCSERGSVKQDTVMA